MVDPETARQAVQAWKRLRGSIAAGDALAVLVPQLLDQLDEEKNAWQKATWNGHTGHDLLMRCSEYESDLYALGERCRQLETALAEIRDYRWSDPNVNVLRHVARAALGDAK